MLTDLSEIVSNSGVDFEINFGVNFGIDFEIDFGLFVLHFFEFRFYKFLDEKKKNPALYAQIGMVFFKLINQKFFFSILFFI